MGRTESWAGLQMFPLQLAYLHGDGTACEDSLLDVGVLGLGLGLGSPLLCCLTLARLFLNHTCCRIKQTNICPFESQIGAFKQVECTLLSIVVFT